MPLEAPFPGHTGLTNFSDLRRDLEGMVVRNSAGAMRAGIFPDHLNAIVTGRTDMKVNIASFRGVQDRGGAVLLANVGTDTSVQLAAAPAANKRIDLIYVTMRSTDLGDPASTPIFGVVQGTASPTPTVPSLPPNLADALPLATVEIPAGATTTLSAGVIISPVYPYTALAGGTVVVRNTVELAAWTPGDGAKAYCLSDNGDYVRSASVWARVGGEIIGLVEAGGSIGSGWVAGTGPNTPRILREWNRRTLYGSVAHTSAGNMGIVLTVPVADRPTTGGERLIGLASFRPATPTGVLISQMALNAGVIGNKSISASAPSGYTYDLNGLSWLMD